MSRTVKADCINAIRPAWIYTIAYLSHNSPSIINSSTIRIFVKGEKHPFLSFFFVFEKNCWKRVFKIVFSGVSDSDDPWKMHPIPVSNESLSLSLSLRSPLLSPIRCRALRARSRARIECSRGEENTGGRIFTSLGYSSSSSSSLAARSISIAIGTAKAAGPDNRKPGLRVYADFSFHGAAYADAVVFPVRPRGRRRVCLSTSGPEIFHLSSSPMYVYIYICVYTYTDLCVQVM